LTPSSDLYCSKPRATPGSRLIIDIGSGHGNSADAATNKNDRRARNASKVPLQCCIAVVDKFRMLNRLLRLSALLSVSIAACTAPPPKVSAPINVVVLEGTSWRLVQIVYGDGVIRAAIDRSRYTIGFGAEELLNVRFDCNRGRGSWRSTTPGHLEFGPLALTRAMCPVGSLHDELVRQWPSVRSYVVKEGRLYLSLMADGGTIEFEPAP
jgi:heat shock protein HslJ